MHKYQASIILANFSFFAGSRKTDWAARLVQTTRTCGVQSMVSRAFVEETHFTAFFGSTPKTLGFPTIQHVDILGNPQDLQPVTVHLQDFLFSKVESQTRINIFNSLGLGRRSTHRTSVSFSSFLGRRMFRRSSETTHDSK